MTNPAIDLDIRYFKRYPIEIIFPLNIKNRSFQAKVLELFIPGPRYHSKRSDAFTNRRRHRLKH